MKPKITLQFPSKSQKCILSEKPIFTPIQTNSGQPSYCYTSQNTHLLTIKNNYGVSSSYNPNSQTWCPIELLDVYIKHICICINFQFLVLYFLSVCGISRYHTCRKSCLRKYVGLFHYLHWKPNYPTLMHYGCRMRTGWRQLGPFQTYSFWVCEAL